MESNKDNSKEEENKKESKLLYNLWRYISETVASVAIAISLFVIIFVLINIFQIQVQKDLYSNIFGYSLLEVKSGSMEDSIKIGDAVVLDIIEPKTSRHNIEKDKLTEEELILVKESLNIGDVITFAKNNNLITHRIVQLDDKTLITKGDANNTNDKAITYDEVVGKVINVLPQIGIWKKILTEKVVLIPLLISIMLFMSAILLNTKEDNNKERELNEKRAKIQKGKRFKK